LNRLCVFSMHIQMHVVQFL